MTILLNMSDLRRMYGYFRCSSCRKTWESSHVYCSQGSFQAKYGQECESCRVICMPYRVEKLKCSICGQHDCNCQRNKDRHTDPNKPHRADLCAKCQAGYPCA
ncbi:unnamed protein product [Candidula unifasciata]|uniref:TNFR-Cys domain-containing protein n=1 Tax=Candidula unifasciata TaxID=100452 RepID=A0A8S3ZKP6_9EUPU|nr:unnamed protein product [Candidula unifasciata]